MNDNGKRLRDVDYPRITFHAQERTFDRLLKECSLCDLKETVRKKLGLKPDDIVHLTQLRDSETVDLEDEDDFDAFYAVAHSQRIVNVQVSLSNVPAAAEPPATLDGHKRKHDAQGTPEREIGAHAEGPSKRRKVTFSEPSTEGGEPASAPKEPQGEKRKEVNDSIVSKAPKKKEKASVVSSETPKKKSMEDVSGSKAVEQKGGVQTQKSAPGKQGTPSSTSKRPRPVPKGRPATSNTNDREPEGTSQNARSDEVVSPASQKLVPSKQVTIPKPSTSSKEGGISAEQPSKKPPLKQKADGAGKDQADFPQNLAGAIHDVHSSHSKELEGVQNDDSLAGTKKDVRDKDDSTNTQNEAKGEAKKRTRNSTVNTKKGASDPEANDKTRDMGATLEKSATDPPPANVEVAVQLKNITAKLLEMKRKVVDSPPLDDPQDKHSEGSATGSPEATTNDKSKSSESQGKKGAKSSAASASSATICLVCNKSPKHNLAECLIIQEGPVAIQRRIKALRASKKFSDDEKLPLISELQKIKTEQRKNGGKAQETNVNIQSNPPPELSRPRDGGGRDVADHANGVAGASKDKASHSLSRDPSAPPLDIQSSPDSTPLREVVGKLAGKNSSPNIPCVGDLSRVANLDLDALVKGPRNSLLSINDIPSSDDNNDSDDEKMSGEPAEEEEERHPVKSTRKRSSSERDESQDDNDGTAIEGNQLPTPTNPQPNGNGNAVHDRVDATAIDEAPKSNDRPSKTHVDGSSSAQRAGKETTDPANLAEEIVASSPHRPLNKGLHSPIAEASDTGTPARKRSSAADDVSNVRKRARSTTKTPKKAEGVSLSQVSEAIQDSARTSKIAPSEKPRSRAAAFRARLAKNRRSKVRKVAVKTDDGSAITNEQPEPSPTSMSFDGWTALKDTSSQVDEDGGTMVDELLSSSPLEKSSKFFSSKEDPLSQDPPSATDSDTQDEAEVDSSLKSSRVQHKFRRLSEIGERPGPFYPRLSVPAAFPASAARGTVAELYGRKGKDDAESESESSSDSESESEKKSHFPKRRRAGRM